MRKVSNRIVVLEERYKDLSPKQRAVKINEQLLEDFCVAERQIQNWKRVVNIATAHSADICAEISPSHLMEIAKLPDDKIEVAIKEVKDKQLTVKETALLVDKLLGKESPPLPEGKFQTIVIDPPWPVEKILRDVRPNQVADLDYRTQSIDEIKAWPIKELAHDNCHVYLWTTHKYLPTAFEIFDHWGVNYECLLTWVKNVGFTPFSWMYSTEHVLFGRIGNLELLKKGLRLDFKGKVTKHSCKPQEFYDRVTEASPEPRLEMFAREVHEGFEPWGNEVQKTEEADNVS